jgi:iron complex outermembrane receptor protein
MKGIFVAASPLALSMVLALAAAPAVAQTVPAAPAPAPATPAAAPDGEAAGEIIVTAQRRSENLQTVPVAITVVGGDAMRAQNINGTEQLDRVVPSLTFKRGTANVNSAIAIRGIGTQTFASGAEPSVSAVIDGVVYGRSGMATQDFADVDRIEVLRGPQGTLFGKNASAGALNIITKNPADHLSIDASAAYFGKNEFRATGTVSGPLSANVRALISGYYGYYDGSAVNVYNHDRVNGYKRYGIKAKVIADLGDLRLTLAGDSSHNKDDCCADILGAVNATGNAQWTNLVLPAQLPVVPGWGNRSVNNNFNPGTIDTNRGVSLTADWKFGDGYTLTSISAYRQWKNEQLRDGDFGSVANTYVAIAGHTAAQAATQLIDQRDDGFLNFNQYSEELRLASPSGRFLEYVVGAFIWRTKEYDTFTRSDSFCSDSTLAVDSTGFQPCAVGSSTFVTSSGPANWTTKFQNTAGFGQATLNVSDKFKIIAGLRYTHDEVNYSITRTNITNGTGLNLYPGIQPAFSYAESASANGLSGKAGVQYQANPNFMAYATYSRGYKGPALNVFYSEAASNTGAIAPERSNAEELGVKIRAFDRKLTLNAAIYNQVLENFQANSFVTQGLQTFVTLTNAGRVRSRGFEMDFSLRATDALTFNGGYAYNEGTIRAYNCASTLTPANLATCLAHNGKPLPFAPKHKLNVSGDWLLPLGDSLPFDVHLGSTLSYTSQINFDIDQSPLAQQPGYAIVDASITFQSKDKHWSLALLGKNLTDQYYTSFITPAGFYQRLQVPRDAERYFGARVEFHY